MIIYLLATLLAVTRRIIYKVGLGYVGLGYVGLGYVGLGYVGLHLFVIT